MSDFCGTWSAAAAYVSLLTGRRIAAGMVMAFVFAGSLSVSQARNAQIESSPSLAEPSISPDHTRIAFVSGGDIWTVPSRGGVANLLLDCGGGARRPLWSPDGRRLAFLSRRATTAGINVFDFATHTTRRVSHDGAADTLDGWAPDGSHLYFSTWSHGIASSQDVYRVDVSGGTPMPVLDEPYVNKMDAAPWYGSTIAFVRGGSLDWWRRGHSHMDETEIDVRLADGRYDRVTTGGAKDRWPMWAADGRTLYWISDRNGVDEIWVRRDHSAAKPLTTLPPGRILWPTLSKDARVIAFERDLSIWTFDTASRSVNRIAIALDDRPERSERRHLSLSDAISDFDVSPDGSVIALVAHGRLFIADERADKPARELPGTAAELSSPTWSADGSRLAYVVDQGDEQAVALYELATRTVRTITAPQQHDGFPRISPDGQHIAYVRDGRELRLHDVSSGADRILATGTMARHPYGSRGDLAFSPAGDWIAYLNQGPSGYWNIRAVPTSGGRSVALTELPNENIGPVAWAPDGMRIFTVTSQSHEDGTLVMVDVSVKGGRPAELQRRVTFLPMSANIVAVRTTSQRGVSIVAATAGGRQNLYRLTVDPDGAHPPRMSQLTTDGGLKSNIAVTADPARVFFLEHGRISMTSGATAAEPKVLPLSVEYDAEPGAERALAFRQGWSLLEHWFADPTFHGKDWGAIRRTYEPHARGATTPQEFARILSLMVGELDASHLGVSAAPTEQYASRGRLGIRWDAAEYARSKRLRIDRVITGGPAEKAGLKSGDRVLSVEDFAIGAGTDIDDLLLGRAATATRLGITAARGGPERNVVVVPVPTYEERDLAYDEWVASRRAYVQRASGGRFGYVHLYDMGADSLRRFYTDLDEYTRARIGVIIDIRNNAGGSRDPEFIDVLARREYVRLKSRFGHDPSARTDEGQRVLDRPTVLLVNEHTFSDGENFTEGYRELRLGSVVGVPTAGAVLFGGAVSLADGTSMRLPIARVFTKHGVDMELHPRPVDVRIEALPGDAAQGRDRQLDAAIQVLNRSTSKRGPFAWNSRAPARSAWSTRFGCELTRRPDDRHETNPAIFLRRR